MDANTDAMLDRIAKLVSIHAPVMDANDNRKIRTLIIKGFNPRARDGREAAAFFGRIYAPVSIHAPVMDANGYHKGRSMPDIVSIHAPVMDAKSV